MSLTPQFLLAILVCRGQIVKQNCTCCGEMKSVFVRQSNLYNVKKTLLSRKLFLVGNFTSKTPTDTITSKVWQYSLWYHHFKGQVVFSLVEAIHKSGSFPNGTIPSKIGSVCNGIITSDSVMAYFDCYLHFQDSDTGTVQSLQRLWWYSGWHTHFKESGSLLNKIKTNTASKPAYKSHMLIKINGRVY
jgi:hypothetical protein